ncbi:hypothetical protein EMIT0P265_10063 [Pseudomonas zeae]
MFIRGQHHEHQQLGGFALAGIFRHQMFGASRLVPELALLVGDRLFALHLGNHFTFQHVSHRRAVVFVGDGGLAGFVINLDHHGFFAGGVFQHLVLQDGDFFRRVVGENGRSAKAQGKGSGEEGQGFHGGLPVMIGVLLITVVRRAGYSNGQYSGRSGDQFAGCQKGYWCGGIRLREQARSHRFYGCSPIL